MRRISSVSSPCKRVVMSRVFSSVLPWVLQLSVNPSRLNLARTSKSPPNSVISTLAQPTWELECGLLSTLTSPAGPRTPLTLGRPDAMAWVSSPVEPVVNLVAKLDTPMTFPTSTGSDTLRSNLSKPCLMVSTPSGRRILNCKRSTACKFWFTNHQPSLHFHTSLQIQKLLQPTNIDNETMLNNNNNIRRKKQILFTAVPQCHNILVILD